MSTTTLTETQLPSGTWQLDPVHSDARFSVRYFGIAKFHGSFEKLDAKLEDGRLTGVVDAASVQVRDENLAGHLRSPEFFDVESHPEIRFESVETRGDAGGIVVAGDLTIRGETRRVEARGTVSGPDEDSSGNTRIGVELETVVDRRDFGLNWNQELPKGGYALANDVTLHVELQLVAAEA